MKYLAVVCCLLALILATPWLQLLLVSQLFPQLQQQPTTQSLIYLFTLPVWSLIYIVFSLESWRSTILAASSGTKTWSILFVSVALAPAGALLLSPVAAQLSLALYLTVSASGLLIGTGAALLIRASVRFSSR